jgi:ribosomal-protein-alanine N-acetyltransferase
MVIEDARASDLGPLVELEQLCSSHPRSEPLMAQALSGSGGERVLVARAESGSRELWGFCVFRVAVEEVEIHDVAVHPAQRRRGLARALLARAMELAAATGAEVAHLEVRAENAAAIALYRQVGFEQVGRRAGYYTSPVEDALLFSAPVRILEMPGHGAT